MRGKVALQDRIEGIVDSDWDLYHSYGYEKHQGEETRWSDNQVLEVPQQTAVEVGLDYHIRNLHTPILVPNWAIGVTVYNVTDNRRVGSAKDTIPAWPGGVSDGKGRRYIPVGTIGEATTYRVKLWANQNELENPDDIPDASWR